MSTVAKSDCLPCIDDVERAVALIEKIEKSKEELKLIEKKLIAAALAAPELHLPLEEEERDGKQVVVRSRAGVRVPILFTSDNLVKSFARDSSVHEKIKDAAGSHFDVLFKPINTFKTFFDDAQVFRQKCRELFGNASPAVISACVARDKDGIPTSQTKIDWSRVTVENTTPTA